MAVVTQRAVVRSREWAVTPPRVDLLSAKRETSGLRKHATCPAGLGVWSVRVGDKTEPAPHGSLTAWHRSLSYLTHTMPAAYASADKRSELIRAATLLLHEQGFQRTTLADVAGAADVPLGNVYYYFKSKEALAEAVIASHQAALRERFASWAAAHRDPRMRLRCLVRAPLDSADRIIQFGCPHHRDDPERSHRRVHAEHGEARTARGRHHAGCRNSQACRVGYRKPHHCCRGPSP